MRLTLASLLVATRLLSVNPAALANHEPSFGDSTIDLWGAAWGKTKVTVKVEAGKRPWLI